MKKSTVKRIWVAGILLSLCVTLLLGIIVTIEDKRISKEKNELNNLEYDKEMRFRNYQYYVDATLKDKLARLTYMVALQGNLSEQAKEAIYSEYLEARRLGLSYTYLIHTGNIPSENLEKSWEIMSYEEIQKEINKLLDSSNVDSLYKKINDKKEEIDKLEREKSNFIILITIVQVIGLVLINASEFIKNK